MNIDIDPKEGGNDYGYQISDARFWLVFWVQKTQLAKARKAITGLHVSDESVFGKTGYGARVWICRDKRCYWIAIGDADSKDVCYKISKADFTQLIKAEPTQ
jgi:hypothetical protein